MKRVLALCACVCVLSCAAGCRNESKVVKPAGNPLFPRSLAGTWRTPPNLDVPHWTIVLSPDGTLSSAIISLMGARIKPNQTTKLEMRDGSFSTLTAGDCPVDYDPVTRELSVVVYIEKIHIKFMNIVNDGYEKDVFSGKVSEDGKSWLPDWIGLFKYSRDLVQNPNDAYNGVLPFEKASDWKGN